MSQPATDPRERTILMMAIGTLCLIVMMAGVSVMTLLTILFPPPIPEGAVPDATGVDVTVPAPQGLGDAASGDKTSLAGDAGLPDSSESLPGAREGS